MKIDKAVMPKWALKLLFYPTKKYLYCFICEQGSQLKDLAYLAKPLDQI